MGPLEGACEWIESCFKPMRKQARMRIAPLASLVLTALIGTGSLAASAAPMPTEQTTEQTSPTARPSSARASGSDADQYAAREAKDTAVASFKGGDGTYIYIGGGVLTVIIVLIIVLILV
jgi:hypothetical protein